MNPRSISILPVLNGFVVQAGCQQIVFDSPAKLGAAITEYYTDPAKTEKSYIANAINKTMDVCQPEAPIRPDRVIREPVPYRTEQCEAAEPKCSPAPAMTQDAARNILNR